ncbi:MAG: hypothetical protein DWQ44_03135 [Bacteroidetes bacterium]|mgnify:CR=1 FL=1|nr:MAG: hypothetical protein DWQ33_04670 [Bacteroidota bacterium]REK00004.1 MAG: hypothetical protein DWQ39_13940 [Bacteroidota bacterium]REK35817.1 MAG: hypothetical protein DWQ44_03135 [Bacteroidota bacterium]REK49312.1 MAG: hypothetical protein DWQ48_07720 [Bacteroidota bacterium]
MKIALFIFFCCISAFSQAQVWRSELPFSYESGNRLSISGNYKFGSDAITNEFAQAYFLNKFIGTELKDNVSSNLKEKNRFGADYNFNIEFRSEADTIMGISGASFIFNFSNRYFLDSRFPGDAFELYFRGNKMFEGQTADIGKFELNAFRYQQVSAGIEIQRSANKSSSCYALISLNRGIDYFGIRTNESSLFTAQDGFYMDLGLDMEIRQSDSLRRRFQGAGASLSAGWSAEFSSSSQLTAYFQNLGFINWGSRSAYIPVDTSFRFEGIDVSELFNFSDSVRGIVDNDSAYIQAFLTNRKKESFIMKTPARIGMNYYKKFDGDRMIAGAGIEHVLFYNTGFSGWTEFRYKTGKYHHTGVKLLYGLYGNLDAGLSYLLHIPGNFTVMLQSDYLVGMLTGSKGKAQGAFVSLSKTF